ncbi:VENN motif pre-toxin domain-containing protein [Yersinia alsatica]|uniref:VENN motif pre-toxin domain-containing protein n=1 Tax=Yersinia alsatica TaxID=2890317 RepID=UPI003703B1C5
MNWPPSTSKTVCTRISIPKTSQKQVIVNLSSLAAGRSGDISGDSAVRVVPLPGHRPGRMWWRIAI